MKEMEQCLKQNREMGIASQWEETGAQCIMGQCSSLLRILWNSILKHQD